MVSYLCIAVVSMAMILLPYFSIPQDFRFFYPLSFLPIALIRNPSSSYDPQVPQLGPGPSLQRMLPT